MMAKTGMLVVTKPSKFVRLVPRLQREVRNKLYVQLLGDEWKGGAGRVDAGPRFSSAVRSVYRDSVAARGLDVRVLLSGLRNPARSHIATRDPVEIVYFDHDRDRDDMLGYLDRVRNRTPDCRVVSLGRDDDDDDRWTPDADHLETYDWVVLGGTFDRLHNGHKTLLSEAALKSRRSVTVGVTDTQMLKSKKLWELIESCDVRMNNVKEFLEDVAPGLDYHVVPISDMFGPTKDNPHFELLVVSSETVKGGVKVNEVRTANGLAPLQVRSIDLLSDTKLDEVEEDKISSSNDRLRLLGTRLKPPKEPVGLSKWPYIIGLTGGIGSGKSSVSKRLERLGAGVIDCDQVAHQVYSKDQPGYEALLRRFGTGILSDDAQIDRKKLATLVFNDKSKLEELNRVVWPLVERRCVELIRELSPPEGGGRRVVVLEAALLLDAGWDARCHEVWACILPPPEAVRRLMERNKMGEEEALKRLSAQKCNSDYVEASNVVFCTLWHPDYTQKQVQRAWLQLSHHLDQR